MWLELAWETRWDPWAEVRDSRSESSVLVMVQLWATGKAHMRDGQTVADSAEPTDLLLEARKEYPWESPTGYLLMEPQRATIWAGESVADLESNWDIH